MKAPNTNLQAPEKFQAPNLNIWLLTDLKIGIWIFSGAWSLELF